MSGGGTMPGRKASDAGVEDDRGVAGFLRRKLLPVVEAGFPTVAKFQKACGVVDGRPTSTVLHAIFTFGSALGNEICFISLLPYLFWEYDTLVSRHLVLLWSLAYFVGQAGKDWLKLPRPYPSQVARLEGHYAAEYGLPSTHAMNSVMMPWFIVIDSWERIGTASDAALLVFLATFWTCSCCLSRLYMGVHSPADVVAGIVIGAVACGLWLVVAQTVDGWLMGTPLAPLLIAVAACGLMWVYPKPKKWVNSPGDSAVILGVVSGVVAGLFINHDPNENEWVTIQLPGIWGFILSLPRLMIGFLLLVLTRAMVKAFGIFAFTHAAGGPNSKPAAQRYEVELPTKLLTYACVGFNAVAVAPALQGVSGL